MNIGVVCPDFNWHFIDPHISDWATNNTIIRFNPRSTDGAFPRKLLEKFMDVVDVCWVEWGLAHLVTITHLPNCKPLVVRLHRYDAYVPHHAYVDWSKVKKIVFVGEHIRRDFHAGFTNAKAESVTVSNGIDLSMFKPLDNHTYGKVAGTVSTMTANKGIAQMFSIVARQKGWKLLLRCGGGQGAATTPGYEAGIKAAIARYPNAQLIPPIKHEDMPQFYHGLDVYINFSQVESNSVTLMEAMACGCYPIIKHWTGADELYPTDCLVDNIGQAVRKLRMWEGWSEEKKKEVSVECRKWVEERYDIKKIYPVMKKIIEEAAK